MIIMITNGNNDTNYNGNYDEKTIAQKTKIWHPIFTRADKTAHFQLS